jgi:prepilin-type processing-associated H-X9-DG protein
VNAFIGLGGKGGKGLKRLPPVGSADVVNPSEMIAIGDSFIGWQSSIIDGRYDTIGLRFGITPRKGETARSLKRHSGQGEFLFCDGHVEGMPLDQLYSNAGTKLGRMWNRDNQIHPERLK